MTMNPRTCILTGLIRDNTWPRHADQSSITLDELVDYVATALATRDVKVGRLWIGNTTPAPTQDPSKQTPSED